MLGFSDFSSYWALLGRSRMYRDLSVMVSSAWGLSSSSDAPPMDELLEREVGTTTLSPYIAVWLSGIISRGPFLPCADSLSFSVSSTSIARPAALSRPSFHALHSSSRAAT